MKIAKLSWNMKTEVDKETGKSKKSWYARTVFGTLYFTKEGKTFYLKMWLAVPSKSGVLCHPISVHSLIGKFKSKELAKAQAEKTNQKESAKWIQQFTK